jgi:hypothetical protein
MDETAIYLDNPSNYTFARVGSRRVKAVTTGCERARLSAAFGATASGIKLPILVLVPRKTDLPNFIPPSNVKLIYKSNSTFNEEIIEYYLNTIISEYKNQKNVDQVKLVLDSARCHLTKRVDNALLLNNIKPLFVPPRMTNLLQPADVCWFAVLKKNYHEKWNSWFIHDDKTYTKHGNPKSPGYAKCISWLSNIWEDFDTDLIVNSFDQCGIVSQYMLHHSLKHILTNQQIIFNYIDNLQEHDEIDSFDSNEDNLFEPNNDSEEAEPELVQQPSATEIQLAQQPSATEIQLAQQQPISNYNYIEQQQIDNFHYFEQRPITIYQQFDQQPLAYHQLAPQQQQIFTQLAPQQQAPFTQLAPQQQQIFTQLAPQQQAPLTQLAPQQQQIFTQLAPQQQETFTQVETQPAAEHQQTVIKKPGRGRPKGSKNKPKN